MVKPAEPGIYNEFIRGLELVTISLEKLKVDFPGASAPDVGQLEISLDDKKTKEVLPDNNVKILHRHIIVIKPVGKDDVYFKFDSTFAVLYQTASEMSLAIWEVFKNRNIYMITWPYLRELFQSTLYRFNLPPLTLPARKT